jgi:hypothetical protein
MTQKSFGQIVPLQGGMLFLAGYGPSGAEGIRDLEKKHDDPEIIAWMQEGRKTLRKLTGQDHGFSLMRWHDFLMNDAKESASYMRPRTWPAVERAISAELGNADRGRLEALAEASLQPPH